MINKITTARSIAPAAPVKERNLVAALKSSLIFLKIGQFQLFQSFQWVPIVQRRFGVPTLFTARSSQRVSTWIEGE